MKGKKFIISLSGISTKQKQGLFYVMSKFPHLPYLHTQKKRLIHIFVSPLSDYAMMAGARRNTFLFFIVVWVFFKDGTQISHFSMNL